MASTIMLLCALIYFHVLTTTFSEARRLGKRKGSLHSLSKAADLSADLSNAFEDVSNVKFAEAFIHQLDPEGKSNIAISGPSSDGTYTELRTVFAGMTIQPCDSGGKLKTEKYWQQLSNRCSLGGIFFGLKSKKYYALTNVHCVAPTKYAVKIQDGEVVFVDDSLQKKKDKTLRKLQNTHVCSVKGSFTKESFFVGRVVALDFGKQNVDAALIELWSNDEDQQAYLRQLAVSRGVKEEDVKMPATVAVFPYVGSAGTIIDDFKNGRTPQYANYGELVKKTARNLYCEDTESVVAKMFGQTSGWTKAGDYGAFKGAGSECVFADNAGRKMSSTTTPKILDTTFFQEGDSGSILFFRVEAVKPPPNEGRKVVKEGGKSENEHGKDTSYYATALMNSHGTLPPLQECPADLIQVATGHDLKDIFEKQLPRLFPSVMEKIGTLVNFMWVPGPKKKGKPQNPLEICSPDDESEHGSDFFCGMFGR